MEEARHKKQGGFNLRCVFETGRRTQMTQSRAMSCYMDIVYALLNRTRSKYWLSHSVDICGWASYSAPLSLSFITHRMGRVIDAEGACAAHLCVIKGLEDSHALSKL